MSRLLWVVVSLSLVAHCLNGTDEDVYIPKGLGEIRTGLLAGPPSTR